MSRQERASCFAFKDCVTSANVVPFFFRSMFAFYANSQFIDKLSNLTFTRELSIRFNNKRNKIKEERVSENLYNHTREEINRAWKITIIIGGQAW